MTWSGGPPSPPNRRAAAGTTIGGRYALRAAVGNGGMGTVWKAADTLLRRDVAVKEVILPLGLAKSDREAMYERTMREARAAAALSHPAVVQVYDVVTEAGRPWIVMELLDARSLADMVIEDGPLGARAVAKIGIALLGALEVAHAAGVLHRDVKPANVLICNDGRCVLTDFGVARMPTDVQLTTPGMVLGSPHFISPERAMGGPFGPPSDLFSLGVTLYTAVEGRPPFDKGDPIETMHAVVEDAPSPPVLAGVLTQVLFGLLEKDPARRWDVSTARNALRELLAGPLASTAPVHQMTDPYAVVPAQRAPWTPPAVTPAPQTGQIGGRAMLAPGESLVDRLSQRQPGDAADTTTAGALPVETAAPAYPAHAAPTSPGFQAPAQPGSAGYGAAGQHTQVGPAYPGGPGYPAGGPVYPGGPISPGSPSSLASSTSPAGAYPAGSGYPPGPPYHQQGWQAPAGAGWPPPDGSHASGGSGGVLSGLRQAGTGLVGKVKGWPRRTQLIAGAAGALVLVLAIVALSSLAGGSGNKTNNPPAGQNQAQNQPSFPVQAYHERGVSMNVPKNWTRANAKTYVDFTDPDDSGRRIRILVETAGTRADPNEFMRSAETNLKKNKSCPDYNRTGLTDEQLANHASTQLEYTCGQQRHGIWRAILQDGKAYSFFLTVEESRFAESKAIFDEMVRSFQLTGTN